MTAERPTLDVLLLGEARLAAEHARLTEAVSATAAPLTCEEQVASVARMLAAAGVGRADVLA